MDAGSVVAESRYTGQRLSELSAGVAVEDAGSIPVTAPATGERIGAVPAGDAAAVERAARRAREAGAAWADRPADERAAVLDRFAGLVLDRRAELLDLLQLETGKSRSDALEELLDVALTADYYARTAPAATADERRRGAFRGVVTAAVTYDPVGVVGVISPWNYPLALSMTDLLPALAAGCPVVCKPDERTPFVALALAELLHEAGLPEEVLRIVTGEGGLVGPAVVDAADYVAFTGSTETGRAVAERAGRNLIGCSLELGGKNPMLVLDDADPERAARIAVEGAFANAGQLCLATERIYVAEPLFEAVRSALAARTRALELGTELAFGPDVGSLIGPDQLDRTERHVEDAVDRGATVLCGGRRRETAGPYVYEPTVLVDVPDDALLADEETFGPVVRIEPVPDVDAAVAAANDTDYGLNASVVTGDADRGRRVARRVDAGTVVVNDAYAAGWGSHDAPLGGRGDSGLGRRHGREGIERFLSARTVATSRIGPPNRLPPSEGLTARVLTGVVRLRRRLGGLL